MTLASAGSGIEEMHSSNPIDVPSLTVATRESRSTPTTVTP